MTRKHVALAFILMLGLAFLNVTALVAQSVMEGKITGTVTDDKGELLPGVSVEITGPSIMGKRATVTSGRGTFIFLNVPPGTYRVEAVWDGGASGPEISGFVDVTVRKADSVPGQPERSRRMVTACSSPITAKASGDAWMCWICRKSGSPKQSRSGS
ncbi:MAG: carboxypeptidase regulatory-like domain-containing protein, partial [Candidatus Aminicenantes bacterium]|nr:carboxypeptidase regulatory-like domain-containing protein [Candidatus Aminicenantes bacterium]